MAVLQAVHDLGVTKVVCKWPNDIWIRGHKLAGFLAEDGHHKVSGNDLNLIILGMGINVNSDVRQSETLSAIATSLRCELGVTVDRARFLAKVCDLLEDILAWPEDVCFKKFKDNNIFQNGMKVLVHDNQMDRDFQATLNSLEENWEISLKGKQ